jgi:hypothetical protein
MLPIKVKQKEATVLRPDIMRTPIKTNGEVIPGRRSRVRISL